LADINYLFSELLRSSESEEIETIIKTLTELSKTNLRFVVEYAIQQIRDYKFDGSKWSSLALTLVNTYPHLDEPGLILEALVDIDKDNGAYLNNYGVFLEIRRRFGLAIEYYARAYATDYKAHGHEKAKIFPAWTNLHRITSSVK
jgi:hypothetical protein